MGPLERVGVGSGYASSNQHHCSTATGSGCSNAPESGEPSFDISVWHLESSARGFANERERERELRKRAAGDEQGLPEDPEIRAIVDRMLKASEPSDGEDKEDLWTIAREFHEWRKRAKNG